MIDTLTQTKSAPIKFTPSAIAEIKRLWSLEKENVFLRIGAKGGGCAGLSYVLEFGEPSEKEQKFYVDDIYVLINPAHLIYLKEIEIDWSGGLNARGFTFKNPNASKTCGCGTSFSV